MKTEHNIQRVILDKDNTICHVWTQEIYSELRAYVKYLHDASTLVVPIAHPIMSTLADKQLELKPWF